MMESNRNTEPNLKDVTVVVINVVRVFWLKFQRGKQRERDEEANEPVDDITVANKSC